MITAVQIRAARAALGWSAFVLAERTGLTRRTVFNVETSNGVPSANARTLQKIIDVLEEHGIEFVGSPEDGPGIRIRVK